MHTTEAGFLEMIGMHKRLLAKRIRLWQGRISDHAVERALVMYEMILLAYLAAISCIILAFISSTAGAGKLVTVTFVVLTFAIPAVLFAIAISCASAAGRDVAQSYGLPRSAGRKARLKSPAQFDRWIATQPVQRR